MKKVTIFTHGFCLGIMAAGLAVTLSGCTKERIERQEEAEMEANFEVVEGGATRNVVVMQNLRSDEVGQLVLSHYENLSTLASASGELSSFISYGHRASAVETETAPFLVSLLEREIVDLETGKAIEINTLSPRERALLLADMVMDDMDRVTERLRESPEALQAYAWHARAVGAVADRYRRGAVTLETLTSSSMVGYDANSLTTMSLPQMPETTTPAFTIYEDLRSSFDNLANLAPMRKGEDHLHLDDIHKKDPNMDYVGGGTACSADDVPIERVLAQWSQHSGRGRLLIRLPNHYSPRTWQTGFFGDFGHVGIMSNYVSANAPYNAQASIDAAPGGVHRRGVNRWLKKHYVARVDHVVYGRKPRKWWEFRGERYVKSRTPINGDKFASLCESYIGRDYTPKYNLWIMKNEAPATFTCTTLAWYCAKRSAGVDISNTSWQVIYPNEIYLDDNVTILANVK